MDDLEQDIVDLLGGRGIAAMPAPTPPDFVGFGLGMSVLDLGFLLDLVAPMPLDLEDELTRHVLSRYCDLPASEVPWRFDLSPVITDDAVQLQASVYIPDPDMDLLAARLRTSIT